MSSQEIARLFFNMVEKQKHTLGALLCLSHAMGNLFSVGSSCQYLGKQRTEIFSSSFKFTLHLPFSIRNMS